MVKRLKIPRLAKGVSRYGASLGPLAHGIYSRKTQREKVCFLPDQRANGRKTVDHLPHTLLLGDAQPVPLCLRPPDGGTRPAYCRGEQIKTGRNVRPLPKFGASDRYSERSLPSERV